MARTYTHMIGLTLSVSLFAFTACSETPGASETAPAMVEAEAPMARTSAPVEAMAMAEPALTDVMAADAAAPAPSGGSYLALSDVHLLPDTAGCSSHYCETTLTFWDQTQVQAQAVVASANPDFIIYLGDMPTHSSEPAGTRDTIFGHVLDGLANIATGTPIPVLYLPGNNDTLGSNAMMGGLNDYCPFTEAGETVFNSASDPAAWPVVNGAADIIDSTHLADGYYAARIPVGSGGTPLRILALNTNIYTTHYTQCSQAAASAGSVQLDWVAAQLSEAQSAGEAVLLAMHVPPGLDGYRSAGQTSPNTMWDPAMTYQGSDTSLQGRWMQDVMLDLVARHEAQITGLIAGHTHLNGIRRLHACDAASTITELLVSVPGISTDHHNNPAFKHISLDAALQPVGVTTFVTTDWTSTPSWTSPVSYDFATNYPNTAPAGSSLLAQIDSMSDTDRQQGMLRYLYARETHNGGAPIPDPGFFIDAMDVTCRN
ncbi:metallophosphoesterase [Maricaulis parjimensis]|uniref:metallophosphoesterase n=1 Tax=Maricaulis parjimensis TaxID=144023 RepID=UPI00193A8D71|nr:metallophosphoesterase [Maricaulis parjimensis]